MNGWFWWRLAVGIALGMMTLSILAWSFAYALAFACVVALCELIWKLWREHF